MDEMWVWKQHTGCCSHLKLLMWTGKYWKKQSWMLTHFLPDRDELLLYLLQKSQPYLDYIILRALTPKWKHTSHLYTIKRNSLITILPRAITCCLRLENVVYSISCKFTTVPRLSSDQLLQNENKYQFVNVHTKWNCLVSCLSSLVKYYVTYNSCYINICGKNHNHTQIQNENKCRTTKCNG